MKLTDIENSLEQERRRLMTEVYRIEGALYALANIRYGTGTEQTKKRRPVSKAVRAKMAASRKARWAKVERNKKG